MTPTPQRTGEAGFTLLEFLVAFAILVAVASALMAAFAVAVRGDHQAAFTTRATLLARSRLATVGVETPLVPGVSTGRLANGTVWQVAIRPDRTVASGAGRAIGCYWVEVTVFDPDTQGKRQVTLTTYAIDRVGVR